jgi:8-oxo-dGTP pyrophosphatase MutT (NUDIX family)
MVDKVAAILMLRINGAALLQHRDNKPSLRCAGMWGLSGGRAESGESMLACAQRELLEETEYNASDLKFLLSLDEIDEWGLPYQVTFFWCQYDGTQPFTCHEGQALSFVKRSMAESYAIPHHLFDVWDDGLAASNATRKINI